VKAAGRPRGDGPNGRIRPKGYGTPPRSGHEAEPLGPDDGGVDVPPGERVAAAEDERDRVGAAADGDGELLIHPPPADQRGTLVERRVKRFAHVGRRIGAMSRDVR
jgi:hypothetical protein